MKRNFRTLTSFLLAVMMFFGLCSFASAESSDVTTLVWWQFNNDPALLEVQVARWNATYPDRQIAVDSQQYSVAELASKLQLAMASGADIPDICDIEISKFGLFMSEDEDEIMLAPLDEYVEKEAAGLSLDRLAAFAYKGHYYGADINLGSALVWYNEELLKEADINYADIKTRDDFEAAGRKFVEATGKPWTAFETTTNNNLLCVLGTYGGEYFDAEGNNIMANEKNVAAFQWMQDMIKEGIAVTADGGSATSEEFFNTFSTGGVACVIMPSWYALTSYYVMPALKGKLACGVIPSIEGNEYTTCYIGGTSTSVPKDSPNAELAKEFVAFIRLSHEAGMEIAEVMGMDTIRLDCYDEIRAKQSELFISSFCAEDCDLYGTIQAAQEHPHRVNITNNYPYAEQVITGTAAYAILVDMADVQETLNEAAEELDSLIQ